MQKTKMVFTVGPASEAEEVLSQLIEAGMSCSRHNFSHGDHAEHKARLDMVKKLREKYNLQIFDTKLNETYKVMAENTKNKKATNN